MMSLRQPASIGLSSGFLRPMHTNSTYRYIGWILLLASVTGMCNSQTSVAAGLLERPNIILVMTDDQGYGELTCHGNPIIRTPHLDRFHKESVRFTDFHVSPTCSPTRCALMTGRHEFRSGVTHTIMERERMSLKATTIA